MPNGKGLVANVMDWVQHPFNAGGSAFNWIMFVGLLIVAAWLWHTVLLSISNEV